jgi:SnoaL-like domain
MNKPAFALFGRRARIGLLVTAGAVASVMIGAGHVNASTLNWFHDDEAEIAKLPVCYSLGTDAIGRGNVAQGKAIYKPCFTNNAVFSVYYPSNPFDGPPAYTTTGTNSWGDYVRDAFTTNGYIATQHLMGSINVKVDDNGIHGTMTSYLHATHVLADGTIDVANGTYEDEVVRQNGVWKIKTRTLKLIDFLNLGTPTP